jgi:hypothetical protein
VAHFEHSAVRARALDRPLTAGILGETSHFRLGIDGPELAALRKKAHQVGIGSRLGEEPNRQVQDFHKIAVPCREPHPLVKPDDTVARVVEGDPQHRLLPPEFGGALLDLVF